MAADAAHAAAASVVQNTRLSMVVVEREAARYVQVDGAAADLLHQCWTNTMKVSYCS